MINLRKRDQKKRQFESCLRFINSRLRFNLNVYKLYRRRFDGRQWKYEKEDDNSESGKNERKKERDM